MPDRILSKRPPGIARRPFARTPVATAAAVSAVVALALGAAGCGRPDTPGAAATGPATAVPNTDADTAVNPQKPRLTSTGPTPGPDATPGCEVLAAPVYRLVNRDDSSTASAASEEVSRLASGVDDNALSAVASRLSGLAAQPNVDDDAIRAQWEQFRQLCDMR